MTAVPHLHATPRPLTRRLLAHPLVRLVIGTLAVVVPVALTMALVQQALDKSMRQVWPQLLAALLCAAGYWLYVRKVEQRPVTELSGAGAGREFGLGAAIGATLILCAIGTLFAAGAFQVAGVGRWTALLSPLPELILVALFEEILFRGIIFRIIERSLGSWAALALSSAIFALAHLPNAGITLLAVSVTAVAGLMLAAAYMLTGRLWLAIGLHFAWNFTSDAVFSLPTSGHAARGLLQGQLSGPEWLTGGAYGVEASLVTLVLIGAATLLLLRVAIRRGHLVAPYWRRAEAA